MREFQETDSGWIGADPDDDLDAQLAAEAEQEDFDLHLPHVMTMLGPIDPGALGPTLVGERLAAFAGLDNAQGPPVEPEWLLAELEDAYAVGVRAVAFAPVLDPAVREREAGLAHWLAARAPVHLLWQAATPDELPWSAGRQTTSTGSGEFLNPGAVASDDRPVLLADPRLLTDRRGEPGTGLRDRRWATGFWTAGSAPVSAVLAPGERWLAVETGAFASPETAAMEIAALVGGGGLGSLMLASGVRDRAGLRAGDGPGLGHVLEWLPVLLLEAGLRAADVRRMLIDNPARLFTIQGQSGEEPDNATR